MKKSNIILLSFICFLFLSAFAIHVGLDAQYKKGRFTAIDRSSQQQPENNFNEISLTASFSKVVISGVAFKENEEHDNFSILYDSAAKNTLFTDKDHPANTTYRIQNDTLFLDIKTNGSAIPAKLTCNNISYIRSDVPTMLLSGSAFDSLGIRSSTSFFTDDQLQCKQLSVSLTGNGHFNLNNIREVNELSLDLQDQAIFESDNSTFNLKNASFRGNSSVDLKGTSLQHFYGKHP